MSSLGLQGQFSCAEPRSLTTPLQRTGEIILALDPELLAAAERYRYAAFLVGGAMFRGYL